MTEFLVKAMVETKVEITITATDEADARRIFDDHIMMTANLVDVDEKNFTVNEDTIWEIDSVTVERI